MDIYASTARAASRSCNLQRPGAAPDSAPGDFDAAAHPIIGRHFFGIEPLRQIGDVAAEVVADLAFRRKIKRLHRLGPRVIGELLAELGAERSGQTVIDKKLDTYATLGPEAIEAAGGDKFWPVPIHEVGNG